MSIRMLVQQLWFAPAYFGVGFLWPTDPDWRYCLALLCVVYADVCGYIQGLNR